MINILRELFNSALKVKKRRQGRTSLEEGPPLHFRPLEEGTIADHQMMRKSAGFTEPELV